MTEFADTLPDTRLPDTLKGNADLDRWIRIDTDGRVLVRTGKVELGQGIRTALTLIAADELGVHPGQIVLHTADTDSAPNEFITAGSMSVEVGGAALRQAMAQARVALLQRAAARLGVDAAQLRIEDGVVLGGEVNEGIGLAELQGGEPFNLRMSAPVAEKQHNEYAWTGRGMPRVDLPAKLRGEGVYVHDLRAPDGCGPLLHARVLRPPTAAHRLAAVDTRAIAALSGVHALVRDGSFVAVIAEAEADAARLREAAERHLDWQRVHAEPAFTRPQAPPAGPANLAAHLKQHEQAALLLHDGTPVDDPIPLIVLPAGERTHAATYTRPFHMHGSIGPSAAMALYTDERLTIWCASQGVELLKRAVADVLGLRPAFVHVLHVEGAGCYGHNGADDVALDAALAARAVPGRAVLMKWSRRDEHTCEPYGSAMQLELAASLDDAGNVSFWSHDVWSYTHSGRPGLPAARGSDGARERRSNLLAAWHIAPPWLPVLPAPGRAPHGGIHRNADPLYAFPARRVVKRFCAPSVLRTSSLRGLGAYANVFAIESFVDELAHLAGADPYAFRLRQLRDPRARAVLQRLRMETSSVAPAAPRPGYAVGRGIAFAQYKNRQTYAAVAIELELDLQRAQIRLLHAWIVADAGRVVDPDGITNQLEGGLVQSASWTLKEAVRFDADGVTSVDWETYPILRFSEVPSVSTVLIHHPELPSLGAGEATQGPTSAAIANALFAASGLRVRDLPLTPDQLRAVAGA